MKRRTFLHTAALTAVSAAAAAEVKPPHIATNTYPWGTFAKRGGKAYAPHSDELFAAIASCGIKGYEPNMQSVADFDGLAQRLAAHGLEMRSLYVNSLLHEKNEAEKSIASVLDVARKAAEIGVKIIVTNPAPIRWGGPDDKTDAQILTQAASLNLLGAELKKLGIILAYHNHDSELRSGAREFHHMLTATDSELVKFCLDAHWVFRGCGDSQVALFDAIEHYGSRIVELHLRQSVGGRWSEVFTTEGDIDHRRLRDWLDKHGMKPHLVLEQAVEKGSPETLDVVTAHQRSLQNTAALFAGW